MNIYLNYMVLLHRFMIISKALYNIHLYNACQCFIPVWDRATPSQINWQLYLVHQSRETNCFCIHLITHTYSTIHAIQLKSEVWWWGHVLTVHTCSFMCTNHVDMIVHTLAFLWVREPCHHLDFHCVTRGWLGFFYQTSCGEIGTLDLPFSKQVP